MVVERELRKFGDQAPFRLADSAPFPIEVRLRLHVVVAEVTTTVNSSA